MQRSRSVLSLWQQQLQRSRHVLWLQQQQLQRPVALAAAGVQQQQFQECPVATAARAGAVSAPASVGKACGSGQGTLQRLEQWRLQRSVAPVAAPSGLRHCSVQQPRRSVLWLQQHLLHRPAALQERPMAPAAPVAALQERPSNTCCSVQQPCRRVPSTCCSVQQSTSCRSVL